MHASKRSAVPMIRASFAAVLLCVSSAAIAQTSNAHPYNLDPYKPSDAQLLRMYGSALVAQTPIEDLATLDPYKPSDAELLRSAGGAIPLFYGYWNWPGPTLVAPRPVIQRLGTPLTATATRSARPGSPLESDTLPLTRSAAAPTSNDGIWIQFDGQRWTTAGRAIQMRDGDFTLAGTYGDQPVYTHTALDDEMIYVLVRPRTLVPFRATP